MWARTSKLTEGSYNRLNTTHTCMKVYGSWNQSPRNNDWIYISEAETKAPETRTEHRSLNMGNELGVTEVSPPEVIKKDHYCKTKEVWGLYLDYGCPVWINTCQLTHNEVKYSVQCGYNMVLNSQLLQLATSDTRLMFQDRVFTV